MLSHTGIRKKEYAPFKREVPAAKVPPDLFFCVSRCVPVTQKQRLARPFIFLYNPLRGITTYAVCSHGADLLKTAVLAAKEEFPKLQLKFCFLCIRGGGVMSY